MVTIFFQNIQGWVRVNGLVRGLARSLAMYCRWGLVMWYPCHAESLWIGCKKGAFTGSMIGKEFHNGSCPMFRKWGRGKRKYGERGERTIPAARGTNERCWSAVYTDLQHWIAPSSMVPNAAPAHRFTLGQQQCLTCGNQVWVIHVVWDSGWEHGSSDSWRSGGAIKWQLTWVDASHQPTTLQQQLKCTRHRQQVMSQCHMGQ